LNYSLELNYNGMTAWSVTLGQHERSHQIPFVLSTWWHLVLTMTWRAQTPRSSRSLTITGKWTDSPLNASGAIRS